jgi:hypothetical protein
MGEIFQRRKEIELEACAYVEWQLNYLGYRVDWIAKDREKVLPNLGNLRYVEPIEPWDILFIYAPDGRCEHKRKKKRFYIEVKVAPGNVNYVRLSLGNLYVWVYLPLIFIVVRDREILATKEINSSSVTAIWAYRYETKPLYKRLVEWAKKRFKNAKVMYLEALSEYPFSPYAVVDISQFRPLKEVLQ